MNKEDIRTVLEELYCRYNREGCLADDPLCFVHQFPEKEDMEIVALIASSLAYGNMKTIMNSIHEVLGRMKPSPSQFIRSCDLSVDGGAFRGVTHRFSTGKDIADLLFLIKQMIVRSGSIERFFMEGYSCGSGIERALALFSERALRLLQIHARKRTVKHGKEMRKARRGSGVEFFFPSPRDGSSCKRLNLFLRWMVRRDNLDLGLWNGVLRSELVIPVDTHILDAARRLRLTKRKNPSWRGAVEITDALRSFDPDDPVKYDFSLCHYHREGRI